MKIREKLLDFKRRLSDRKMYSVTIVIIGLVAIWGGYQYKQASSLRQELDNQYNRAFFDMVGYVENVETLLAKSLISNTPTKTSTTLKETWRQANMAQENLGLLPISQQTLANTSKFLVQVGDLSYTLSNQNLNGKPLTVKQYEMVESLNNYSITLQNSLKELEGELTTGRLKWGELRKKGGAALQKTSNQVKMQQFEDLDKTFQKYPSLIYDGPFSDHLTEVKPKGIFGKVYTVESAKEVITNYFGKNNIESITNVGKVDNSPIKTFGYSIKFKNTPKEQVANIDISKQGGKIVWMLYPRPVDSIKIDVNKAKELAKTFLDKIGYENMASTYFLKEGNTITINFAYETNNVIVYPDLIKIKVALDSGEIIGLECNGYLHSHTKRNISPPKLSLEDARKSIGSNLKITSSGLAIIPTKYKTEIFVYEFKGKLNKRDFIIYINADTGAEEEILLIINTPNGTLTM